MSSGGITYRLRISPFGECKPNITSPTNNDVCKSDEVSTYETEETFFLRVFVFFILLYFLLIDDNL